MLSESIGHKVWTHWKRLSSGSVNQRIFGAAMTMAVLTFGVKIVSSVKEMFVAGSFGVGDAVDAFLIAYVLPGFITTIVGASFSAALIPVFIETRARHGHDAVQRLISEIGAITLVLLVVVATALVPAGPYLLTWLGASFEPTKLALTQSMFLILLPSIVLSGLSTLYGAVLQANERFAYVSLATGAVPLASILVLVVFANTWGVRALAIGLNVGFALELALLVVGVYRQGWHLWPRWHGLDPATRRVIEQYMPMIAGSMLMSSSLIVDQAMAASLGPGSVSALNYGNKVSALVVGMTTTALGTAVLPYFSKMITAGDWHAIRHTLKTYIVLTFAATIPATLVLVLLSETIVRLLFQRGAFSASDTHIVAVVQAMLVLQLPFHTASILLVRLISALRANHILMWGTMINVAVNIGGNYVLMRYLGVAGIGLATSLVYVVSFAFLSWMLYRLWQQVAQTQ